MANSLYDLGRESFLKGEISWSGDNIKACLVDSASYTPDTAADQFLSDLSGVVATSGNLASKTTTDGARVWVELDTDTTDVDLIVREGE